MKKLHHYNINPNKATSGPWEAVVHETITGDLYIQLLAGSWDIAHTKYSARDFEEELANAALMVAAQRMYSYIYTKAKKGDQEAQTIIDNITKPQ